MRVLMLCLFVVASPAGLAQIGGPDDPWPPPNARLQTPAFYTQTRAPKLESNIDFKVDEVASGLFHPWAIEFLPDNSLLITERLGRMRIVTRQGAQEKGAQEKGLSEPIANVPPVDSRDQGGLLDVILDPDFADNRLIYFSYAEPRGNGETGTTVARARLSEDRAALEEVEIIFRQMPAWRSTKHYGSRLVWNGGGALFVTLGERSHPQPRQLAQDLSTHLGKVVRILPDGSVPPDNPFVGEESVAGEEEVLSDIWSYGHRNIQGAAIHPQTGELWTIEHGPRGGDEVNIPKAGENYGWPVITYGEDYSGAPIGDGITQQQGMEQPIYYWDPVIAPAGALFYQGDLFGEWQGDLLISSLKPGGLVRLELDGRLVTGEERLLTDLGRVRDIATGPDGALWVITDERNGKLLRITPE